MKTIHNLIKMIGGMFFISLFPLMIWFIWSSEKEPNMLAVKIMTTNIIIIALLVIIDKTITNEK